MNTVKIMTIIEPGDIIIFRTGGKDVRGVVTNWKPNNKNSVVVFVSGTEYYEVELSKVVEKV